MKFCQWLSFVLFGFVLTSTLTAAERRRIRPEDLARTLAVSNPQISPDGTRIAFEVAEPTGIKKSELHGNVDIWIVPSDGSKVPEKFVYSIYKDYSPLWSPDGEYLAFLSDRGMNRKVQIYIQTLNSKQVQQLTKFDTDIISFQWISSDCIAFVAKDTLAAEQKVSVKREGDVIIVGENKGFNRLWEVNTVSKKLKIVTKVNKNVITFDYSPDGKKIVIKVSPGLQEDDVSFHSKLVILNRDGSEGRELGGSDKGFSLNNCWGVPKWSPDGKWISSFVTVGTTYLPVLFSIQDGKGEILAERYRGTIWYMDWNPKTRSLYFSGNEGVQGVFGKIDVKTHEISHIKDVNRSYSEVSNWSFSSDGCLLAYQDATFDSPDDIWIMKPDGSSSKKLTNMNPHFSELLFGKQKVIHWKSYDGLEIEGVLIKPVFYDSTRTYPTIVQVHGGPTWAWWNGCLANWHEWAQLLANHGFAVLFPNPRGSNGYGQKFAVANYRDLGGRDFEDIMSGLDYLIEIGIADSTNLGIGGWSYGGFMTAWAVTQTNRFKSAVMGASVTDLKTMYCTSTKHEYFSTLLGDNPFGEQGQVYLNHSPVTFVNQVRTPTMILHGEVDHVVPLTQSYEFYQGLKDKGVVNKFVIYPRETHSIREYTHQLDMMKRIVDWFSYYLKDEE